MLFILWEKFLVHLRKDVLFKFVDLLNNNIVITIAIFNDYIQCFYLKVEGYGVLVLFLLESVCENVLVTFMLLKVNNVYE